MCFEPLPSRASLVGIAVQARHDESSVISGIGIVVVERVTWMAQVVRCREVSGNGFETNEVQLPLFFTSIAGGHGRRFAHLQRAASRPSVEGTRAGSRIPSDGSARNRFHARWIRNDC